MELLDVFNKDGEKVRTIVRGDKNLKEDEYIKLTTIWLKSGDKYLIQECSAEKGGEFAVTGGHVQSGKTTREQAIIELKEELNLDASAKDLKFLGTVPRTNAVMEVFLIEDDKLLGYNFTLQKEEVKAVFWLTKKEINDLIKSDNFRKSSAIQFDKFIK